MNIKFDSALFAKEIKSKRIIDDNMTQIQLAQALDISTAKIQKFEAGETPGVNDLMTICNWLNCGPEKFIISN